MSWGVTPAIPNARGAASVSPMWNGSGRLAMSSAGYGWPSAAPRTTAGAWGRSRARSTEVTTTAAAQSVSRQQSKSRNGSDTQRAAR